MNELTTTFRIESPPAWLEIGYDAENNWRTITINCEYWFNINANGVVVLMYKPACSKPAYPLKVNRSGNNIVWTPESAELVAGVGTMQAFFEVDGTTIGASKKIPCEVDGSLLGSASGGTPPWAVDVLEQMKQLGAGAVMPEQFGAIGDGLTDDTAAVRRAMQEPFVVLKGTYKVTSGISALANVVCGNGKAKILSSGGDCLTFANNVYLSDFAIETPYQTDGIAIRAQKDVIAERLAITGGRIGIQSDGLYFKNIFRGNTFKNFWGDSAAAVHVLYAGVSEFSNNYVSNVNNDLDRDADGVRFWQSKNNPHTVVRIVGNEFYNCKGRFIKAGTMFCHVADNYCHNDTDFPTITYCSAIDIQNGNSEVRNNLVIFPTGINLSVRADDNSYHLVEGNHLYRIAREGAGNYTALGVTDYTEASGVHVDVTIRGNDIHGWSDKVPIGLPYIANAVYRLYNNLVYDKNYDAVALRGTEDRSCRFEMLGNVVDGYPYFCRFSGSMPNVKGDRSIYCETPLVFSDVLADTSYVVNTSEVDGFIRTSFLRTNGPGSSTYVVELSDNSEVGAYKTNGRQIYYFSA